MLLLGGCAVFLMGMKQMSDGLERSAGRELKSLFGKISNNRFAGYGIGLSVTSLIQSSAATTVMTMGFVNAGIMTLYQATAIVLGAKLGTTITGILVSLSAFSIGKFDINLIFVAVALVGVLMIMFSRRDKLNKIGSIIAGFGFIFIGLYIMKDAMSAQVIKDLFAKIFKRIDNPFLLLLVGMAFTALIQSSSASTGMYITMIGVSIIDLKQAFFLVIGSNIGTCITAILASVGASVDAKRVAFLHVFSSLLGAVFMSIILAFLQNPIASLFENLFTKREWQLATFNVMYNLLYTLLLLPFVSQLTKLAQTFISNKRGKEKKQILSFVDERILQTPVIAVAQIQKEVVAMASRSKENFELSIKAILSRSIADKDYIMQQEGIINELNKEITNYLIKISSLSISQADEKIIGTLHHVVNDIERIGDHAENFIETAEGMLNNDISFSDAAKKEITEMYDKLESMFEKSIYTIDTRSGSQLREIGALEEQVDTLTRVFNNKHIERLSAGKCTVESGTYFYDLVTELERVGDHIVNIAFSIKSPTGQQSF